MSTFVKQQPTRKRPGIPKMLRALEPKFPAEFDAHSIRRLFQKHYPGIIEQVDTPHYLNNVLASLCREGHYLLVTPPVNGRSHGYPAVYRLNPNPPTVADNTPPPLVILPDPPQPVPAPVPVIGERVKRFVPDPRVLTPARPIPLEPRVVPQIPIEQPKTAPAPPQVIRGFNPNVPPLHLIEKRLTELRTQHAALVPGTPLRKDLEGLIADYERKERMARSFGEGQAV